MSEDQPRKKTVEEPGWEGYHDLETEQMPLWPRMATKVTRAVCRRRERQSHSGIQKLGLGGVSLYKEFKQQTSKSRTLGSLSLFKKCN